MNGSNNVAIGYLAARSGSGGPDYMVAIGSKASYNCGSDQGVAIGYEAVGSASAVSGGSGVAIGYRAGYIGSINSVVIGTNSSQAGARFVTAVGFSAMQNAEGTSNYGVGIGAYALQTPPEPIT